MLSSERIIYCINQNCDHPVNPVGERFCSSCQTPLVHRYLWATGSLATEIPLGTKVVDRYEVISPQVWLDTQPGLPPEAPQELPPDVIPYLRLYPERSHLPQVYGFVPSWQEGTDDILLLENVPIDQEGNLYPTIIDAWEQAKPVRQVYWLWQILQLWTPLLELGLVHNLLRSDNLRVQGWCVRLLELNPTIATEQPNLRDLSYSWQPLLELGQTPVTPELQNILQQMANSEVELETIATQLNALLLAAAGELPLTINIAGATDTGPQLTQNEDTCYPNTAVDSPELLVPNLAIVCDGIGGHQGGEVASQLAVQSLKLQMRALLSEVTAQTEIVPPKLLQEQIEASLRVANNLISSRNDEQKRQGRERMATTLVMALQVPQRVLTTSGWQSDNAHELYLANVGDSRAYWITRNYCQLLTVDDDVITREVRLGRSLYRQALQRPDANALTQALGTRDAESLRLMIKRFIIDEDGILLLCSDGLSDHNWVENSWQDYAVPLLTGQMTVEDATHHWINLANEKNGHDNISVVLTLCRISKEYLVPITPPQPLVKVSEAEPAELETYPEESILTESSQALLDLELPDEPSPPPVPKPSSRRKPLVLVGGLLALLVGGTGLGLFAWWQLNPQTFQQMCQKLPPGVQQYCPPSR
ncbi:PP2C family protein-serine/threonine phosphatase [Anabaena subtropica]|uniref:Protein phosphatase 2C domain-containing protein n=1 Tax=Anabaena subtropica FACHB-260 TaxID=2692884 RepID=A0ABR8CKV5_9NOST|nr:protein phosphatase 2C domain-containing protein [Anabaena subtropica]MBD2342750.1 protein phosphatase 2C domain-containing protein [Anabaena subtropica FACHB-260]